MSHSTFSTIIIKSQTSPLHVVDSSPTKLLVRCDFDFAVCRQPDYNTDDPDDLFNNPIEIPAQSYCPEAQDWFIPAPEPIPETWFIKYPRLTLETRSPRARFLREVLACETMAEQPHPNVARYHGVVTGDGLVRGICYERYSCTLNEKVNPDDLPKSEFQYSSKHPLKDKTAFLAGVRAGIAHLRSFGLVHNDLKPSNIMLKDEETEIPVIVDFDSCAAEGTPSSDVGRTLGWHEPGEKGVRASDDDRAIEEIEKWLNEEPVAAKAYAFGVKEVVRTGEWEAIEREIERDGDMGEGKRDAEKMKEKEKEKKDGMKKEKKEGIKKGRAKGKKQQKRRKGKKEATMVPTASTVNTAGA